MNPVYAPGKTAVVRAKYDDVEKVLNFYRLRHDTLEFCDLEQKNLLEEYDALFIPCGCDYPYEANISVYAMSSSIKSVSLRNDTPDPDMNKIAGNIKDFVNRGGAVYFSGYSFRLLDEMYGIFEFFDDFPYMGMPGRLESDVMDDLALFSMKKKMALYMDFPGWIAVKSADGADILSVAAYETPRGIRAGPISFLLEKGSGEILYTSYYSTVHSDFRRFNTYRIAGQKLMRRLLDKAFRWGRDVRGRIVDSIQAGENSRMYRLNLARGKNTIYFLAEKNSFQIDVYDSTMSLIESRDSDRREQAFTVRSDKAGDCFVKVYPSTGARFDMYALLSAKGGGLFPFSGKIFALLIFIALSAGGYYIKANYLAKKYRGRR